MLRTWVLLWCYKSHRVAWTSHVTNWVWIVARLFKQDYCCSWPDHTLLQHTSVIKMFKHRKCWGGWGGLHDFIYWREYLRFFKCFPDRRRNKKTEVFMSSLQTLTDLCALKSSSLSLKPLLSSMLIPFRASSASFTRPVFSSSSSSSLPRAGSVGSAIEVSDTGGEELNAAGRQWQRLGGGVRCVRLPYLQAELSQPVAQFWENADIFIFWHE